MSENMKIDSLEYGNVNISDDVIGVITSIAASEVEGVKGLSGGITENLGEKLGIKNYNKGIKVELVDDQVSLDLTLVVEYGSKIPDLSWRVQEAVKNAIESMTGLNVVAVNVHVNGIVMKKSAESKETQEL